MDTPVTEGDGGALEEQRPREAIVSAFDALVRAAGADAERLVDDWMAHDSLEVRLDAAGLCLEDVVVVAADEDEASWILLAFLAGLRGLRPIESATPNDFSRLAGRLAALQPTSDSLEALHDWLWADGAAGFDVRLSSSVVEQLEVARVSTDLYAFPLGLRGVDDDPDWTGGDRAGPALREQFVVPLEKFRSALQKQAQLASDEDLVNYRTAIENPDGWLDAEIRVALKPALRGAIDAAGLARRITARLDSRIDSGLLALLADLESDDSEYATGVRDALEGRDLGTRLARGAVLRDVPACEALGNFGKAASSETASELAAGLLERVGANPKVYPAVRKTFEVWGVTGAMDRVDASALGKAEATAMVRLLVDAKADATRLNAALALMAPAAAAEALQAVPPKRGADVVERVADLIGCADNNVVKAVLAQTGRWERPGEAAWTTIADALQKTQGKNMVPSILEDACRRVVAAGLGERVVGWVKALALAPRFRIAALEALADEPELRKRASKWRVSDMLEPPSLQSALKRARAEGKEDDD